MSKNPSSRREQMRAQHRARERRRQILIYGGLAIAVAAVVGWAARGALADLFTDVALPAPADVPASADGKAWGPADAPVLVEEFSDFQ